MHQDTGRHAPRYPGPFIQASQYSDPNVFRWIYTNAKTAGELCQPLVQGMTNAQVFAAFNDGRTKPDPETYTPPAEVAELVAGFNKWYHDNNPKPRDKNQPRP